jgi:hypothetical protein
VRSVFFPPFVSSICYLGKDGSSTACRQKEKENIGTENTSCIESFIEGKNEMVTD